MTRKQTAAGRSPLMTEAKALAGSAYRHVSTGAFDRIPGALSPGRKGEKRSGMAALILAANLTPAEQAQLRDWLDRNEGAA